MERIYALAKTWHRLVPNEKRPNFEAAADAVLKRALNEPLKPSRAQLNIRDGALMHQHSPRTARVLERTLRNGVVHPDVLHSFQSGRVKQRSGRPGPRDMGPDPPGLPDIDLYVQHSDADLQYPSHFVPGSGFQSRMHETPSHVQLERPEVQQQMPVPTSGAPAGRSGYV